MRSFSALLCLVLIALSSSRGVALSRDGAERRSNQDSDELRTDMRQRRLKKVEDLEKGRLPAQTGSTPIVLARTQRTRTLFCTLPTYRRQRQDNTALQFDTVSVCAQKFTIIFCRNFHILLLGNHPLHKL